MSLRTRANNFNYLILTLIAGGTAYAFVRLHQLRSQGEFTPYLDDEEMIVRDKQQLETTRSTIRKQLEMANLARVDGRSNQSSCSDDNDGAATESAPSVNNSSWSTTFQGWKASIFG
eukprot:CFRG3409T1